METASVSAVIIGNEVLSDKVVEENGALLIRELKARGIPLRMMLTVPDEVDLIVESLLMARRRARYVITSGGIGPTHDDVTVRAVALALGRRVVRMEPIEELVRNHYKQTVPKEALRLAEAPEGSELLFGEGIWYPVVSCEGIYLLPGVPQLFKLQLRAILKRFPRQPQSMVFIYLDAAESDIAHVLDAVAIACPDVPIGSYPTFDSNLGYKVKVTLEHQNRVRVDEVAQRLLELLPKELVVRIEHDGLSDKKT